MAPPFVNCRGKAKCYRTKDKKSCRTPNPWIVFLRTHKNMFRSIGEASRYYELWFKPDLLNKLIMVAGKNATEKKKKQVYKTLICDYCYKNLKYAGNRTKMSSGVAKILKKHTIPETLALIGAKKASSALLKREKEKKKAEADVAAKKADAEKKKSAAANLIKKALQANVRAKALQREAAAAQARATEAKSAVKTGRGVKRKAPSQMVRAKTKTYQTRAASAPRRNPGRGVKRKASSPSQSAAPASVKKAKTSRATAEKKAKSALLAKRKADTLQASADRAKKKAKVAATALVAAKKTKADVGNKISLKGTALVGSKRKRRA